MAELEAKVPEETLGERIHRLRRRDDLTLEQVADRAGTDTSSLSRYEHDLRPVPSDVLSGLADTFRVSADYLLRGTLSPSSRSIAA